MKYVILLADGMADEPVPSLGEKTPLEWAKTPTFDLLAKKGEVGLVQNVPLGMKPGSDVANLSVMGYDPAQYYTGRSPLEAVSIGIDLAPTDVTLRCNLVTLSGESRYEDRTMVDYSAGEITTEEARAFIEFLRPHLESECRALYLGVSYRHCMVIQNGKTGTKLTPPHDISDRKIKTFLPSGPCGEEYLALMKKSATILADCPLNKARTAAGKPPVSSIWLWGEGTKPNLSPFLEKTGLKGCVISAVDLIRGLGIAAGLTAIDVPGATGNYDTDFQGKANAAVDALLGGADFVYVHMEAPDECGHQGHLAHKIYAIEQIDGVANTVCKRLSAKGEAFCLLILPDHPTPVCTKTHTNKPVPYLLYRSYAERDSDIPFSERGGKTSDVFLANGHEMMAKLLEK